MRIAVLSVWDEAGRHLGELTRSNKQRYCDRHGYEFIVCDSGHDRDREPHWYKIKALRQHLPAFDWIFYTDTDAIIMNQAICLETFLDDHHDFVISYDVNGLNVGNLFMRNTPLMLDYLDLAYQQTRYVGWKNPEQTAMVATLIFRGEYLERTRMVNQKLFNAYGYEHYDWPVKLWEAGQYQPGDFVIHLPGIVPPEKRLALLRRYLGEVDYEGRSDNRNPPGSQPGNRGATPLRSTHEDCCLHKP